MRVFLAGGTGAVGRPLVAQLLVAGHEVVVLTRSPIRAAGLKQQGVVPVVGDVFDAEKLRENVASARPDVVVHQLTALPQRIDPRKIRDELAPTNRLRSKGTRNLMDAALAAGARRFVAQSVAFAYAPDGEGLKTEDDPLYRDAPAAHLELICALEDLETTTLGAQDVEGLVLRFGYFYGPGTFYARDGSFADDVCHRRVPIVGKGSGVFSFILVDDAAAATVAALEHGEPGIYNIVDDDPTPVAEWLPKYARMLSAPPPRRVPRLLGRLVGGPYATYVMCDQRGASNAKAKAALAWSPRYSSWRDGFLRLLTQPPSE